MRRKTTQRIAIDRIFQQHDRPLAVEEILEYGRYLVETLNRATVYRNLKLLVDEGWLKPLTHPTLGTLYERSGKGHHHHFLCRACKRAYNLPGCALKDDEIAPEGFVVEEHEIFLLGVCRYCARSGC